jgi:hypothetical protein
MWAASERMLREAGYEGEVLEASLRVLLETEDVKGTPLTTCQPFDNLYSPFTLEGIDERSDSTIGTSKLEESREERLLIF